MTTSFSPYASEMLPGSFRYPEAYLRLSKSGTPPDLSPWWFIDAESKAGRLAYSVCKHDGRSLIPFAKVDDGRGDVACFDGDDASGNPEVKILVLDDSGRSYSFADFTAWMDAAEADARSYR